MFAGKYLWRKVHYNTSQIKQTSCGCSFVINIGEIMVNFVTDLHLAEPTTVYGIGLIKFDLPKKIEYSEERVKSYLLVLI
jgi:hypothetical protein